MFPEMEASGVPCAGGLQGTAKMERKWIENGEKMECGLQGTALAICRSKEYQNPTIRSARPSALHNGMRHVV